MALGHRRGRARVLVNGLLDGKGRVERSLLLRGLHFVIIDEADSVLIDEAKTPLILSGGDDKPDVERYQLALGFAGELADLVDFSVDESRFGPPHATGASGASEMVSKFRRRFPVAITPRLMRLSNRPSPRCICSIGQALSWFKVQIVDEPPGASYQIVRGSEACIR
jgi:hypothetical protein